MVTVPSVKSGTKTGFCGEDGRVGELTCLLPLECWVTAGKEQTLMSEVEQTVLCSKSAFISEYLDFSIRDVGHLHIFHAFDALGEGRVSVKVNSSHCPCLSVRLFPSVHPKLVKKNGLKGQFTHLPFLFGDFSYQDSQHR